MADPHPAPARPTPRRAPATSDLLANRYVLEEHVATGGMAAVWRAHDEVLARTVAVKVLHDDLCRQDDVRERFRREAVAAAKLVHPGIVSLFDTGVDGGRVYLVIEYVEGRTLADVVRREPLEPGEVARIGARIAAALAHAHDRGIVHRDVKPANVLIGDDGAVKVTDFGIAKAAEDATLTAPGRIMGTAAYVAPEQLRGQPVDARADLYALGLVLHEALTGQRAFPGEDPVAVAEARLAAGPVHPRRQRADVPRALDQVVARLTAPDPEDRPSSATEVAAALRALETPAVVPPVRAEVPEDDGGTVRAEARWLLPVAGLLVLAGALVSVGVFGSRSEDGSVASVFAEEVTPTPTRAAAGQPTPTPRALRVPQVELAAFDPEPGDGDERGGLLANAVDGAPSTVWTTERYDTPAFGNLKDGVGFTVDLGQPRRVTEVSLVVPRGGFDVEVRIADRVEPALEGWTRTARAAEVPAGTTSLELEGAPRTRHLLVWITGELPPSEDGYRAEVGEIRVEALAS